jgi:hypothetical protein
MTPIDIVQVIKEYLSGPVWIDSAHLDEAGWLTVTFRPDKSAGI